MLVINPGEWIMRPGEYELWVPENCAEFVRLPKGSGMTARLLERIVFSHRFSVQGEATNGGWYNILDTRHRKVATDWVEYNKAHTTGKLRVVWHRSVEDVILCS